MSFRDGLKETDEAFVRLLCWIAAIGLVIVPFIVALLTPISSASNLYQEGYGEVYWYIYTGLFVPIIWFFLKKIKVKDVNFGRIIALFGISQIVILVLSLIIFLVAGIIHAAFYKLIVVFVRELNIYH